MAGSLLQEWERQAREICRLIHERRRERGKETATELPANYKPVGQLTELEGLTPLNKASYLKYQIELMLSPGNDVV
jgi:hypothetical protein